MSKQHAAGVTLALDVGNTQTVIGAFERSRLVSDWRISTDPRRTADEYRHLLNGFLDDAGIARPRCERALVSSVVPAVTRALGGLSADLELYVVDWRSPFSFVNCARQPESVGADRLVNAEAAVQKHGVPLIVVDSGTATTFCVIDSDRRYLGGAIAPGVAISSEALFSRASRLASVDLTAPDRAIGDTTETAVQSGVLLGHAALIDGMTQRLAAELRSREESGSRGPAVPWRVKVVGTGGWMDVLGGLCRSIDVVEPNLTLEGLLAVWSNVSRKRTRGRRA
ncbi:MAG: type III pantothenate kinase [Candidatus Wallbacteria bacterium]|nr:type III pantothenate kinase [Candidatus Wallbacteria bacterium]